MRQRRWWAAILLVAGLALGLLGAHAAGFRLNLDTHPVAEPDARATPEQVVTTYVEAYNQRDFSTMRTIYPSSSPTRFGVLGTMNDLAIVQSQSLAEPEDGLPAKPGRSYYRVRVTLRFSGLSDSSDLAYDDGPNGWAYLLERDSDDVPWRIADHGNP
ncbi:hypothetical protein [uncultured Friedmanniella sp.]|uniref:hypothetical protein n=1 Tax=uncultured Friedmanniella sp. TaxID=335381 RepID=UPI0035CC55E8